MSREQNKITCSRSDFSESVTLIYCNFRARQCGDSFASHFFKKSFTTLAFS